MAEKGETRITNKKEVRKIMFHNLVLSIITFFIFIMFSIEAFYHFFMPEIWRVLDFIFAAIFCLIAFLTFMNFLHLFYSFDYLIALINNTNGYLTNFKMYLGFGFSCLLISRSQPNKIKILYSPGEGLDNLYLKVEHNNRKLKPIKNEKVSLYDPYISTIECDNNVIFLSLIHNKNNQEYSVSYQLLPGLSIECFLKGLEILQYQYSKNKG